MAATQQRPSTTATPTSTSIPGSAPGSASASTSTSTSTSASPMPPSTPPPPPPPTPTPPSTQHSTPYPHPDIPVTVERDERWVQELQAELDQRFQNQAQEMHDEYLAEVHAAGPFASEDTRGDLFRRYQNRLEQIRQLQQDEFEQHIEMERQERLWSLGLEDPSWAGWDGVVEGQARILANIQLERTRRTAGNSTSSSSNIDGSNSATRAPGTLDEKIWEQQREDDDEIRRNDEWQRHESQRLRDRQQWAATARLTSHHLWERRQRDLADAAAHAAASKARASESERLSREAHDSAARLRADLSRSALNLDAQERSDVADETGGVPPQRATPPPRVAAAATRAATTPTPTTDPSSTRRWLPPDGAAAGSRGPGRKPSTLFGASPVSSRAPGLEAEPEPMRGQGQGQRDEQTRQVPPSTSASASYVPRQPPPPLYPPNAPGLRTQPLPPTQLPPVTPQRQPASAGSPQSQSYPKSSASSQPPTAGSKGSGFTSSNSTSTTRASPGAPRQGQGQGQATPRSTGNTFSAVPTPPPPSAPEEGISDEQRARVRREYVSQESQRTEAERRRREEEANEQRAEDARRRGAEKRRMEEQAREAERREAERRARANAAAGSGTSSSSSSSSWSGSGTSSSASSIPASLRAAAASAGAIGGVDKRTVAEVWEAYESQWAAMANATQLRFRSIPWPVMMPVASPEMLLPIHIAAFVLHPSHSPGRARKDRLRDALLRWHPDRFEAKWLKKVVEEERESVKDGVGLVVRALNELLSVEGTFAA